MWESMPNVQKVWESVPNVEKGWESVLNVGNIWLWGSIRKYEKVC